MMSAAHPCGIAASRTSSKPAMLFAVLFTDKPAHGALRQDVEVLHWSKALEHKVLV